jgi:hypothetical protein
MSGKVGSSVILEIADSAMLHTNKYILKRGRLALSSESWEFSAR